MSPNFIKPIKPKKTKILTLANIDLKENAAADRSAPAKIEALEKENRMLREQIAGLEKKAE